MLHAVGHPPSLVQLEELLTFGHLMRPGPRAPL